MNEEIFRKKSLDRVKSPESLNDYIHVTNPGIWILMTSIVLLLIGACVWGFFGRLESTADAFVTVEGGTAVCLVSTSDCDSLSVGMTVKFGGCVGQISSIASQNGGKEYRCEVTADGMPADGSYAGKVVTKTVSPISFIWN